MYQEYNIYNIIMYSDVPVAVVVFLKLSITRSLRLQVLLHENKQE